MPTTTVTGWRATETWVDSTSTEMDGRCGVTVREKGRPRSIDQLAAKHSAPILTIPDSTNNRPLFKNLPTRNEYNNKRREVI